MEANTRRVASDFGAITTITDDPSKEGKVLVADQFGPLYRVDTYTGNAEELLNLRPVFDRLPPFSKDAPKGLNPGYDERGFLGFVPKPGFGVSHKRIYVYYSAPPETEEEGINHESVVAEIDLETGEQPIPPLMRIPQPSGTHNGGCLALDSRNYLYISVGDGGCCGDDHGEIGNGQNTQNRLASILRIDPTALDPSNASLGFTPRDNPFVMEHPDILPEIFAYGLRNPWRISVDHYDRVWVGNVGEGEDERGEGWETIFMLHGGENCGWRMTQGSHWFDRDLARRLGITVHQIHPPVFEYSHENNGRAVIGGFVYQGMDFPGLRNCYVFGDWSSSWGAATGNLSFLQEITPMHWERYRLGPKSLGYFLTTIGEGEKGEIFLGVKEGVKHDKPAHLLQVIPV